jgi:hypothetical protein
MNSTEPDGTGDEPVTNGAMSADPEPSGDTGMRIPAGDPVSDPADAAGRLRAAGGGEAVEPDLAELSERDMPSIAAARFDVDIDPESVAGGEPGSRQRER